MNQIRLRPAFAHDVLAAVLFDLDGTLVESSRGRSGPNAPTEFDPRAVAAVHAIASRYRVGIVSDGSSDRQRGKLAATGLAPLMSVITISAEVRAQKPSCKIFGVALESLDLRADRVLFVGDDIRRDVAGARDAGLRTCWISHGRETPSRGPTPDLVARDVFDLPGMLLC